MSVKPDTPWAQAQLALRLRWQALSAREQGLLTWGATLLAGALLWWVALAPALRTVSEAPAQQAALDAQWQQLQELQAQAQSLQQQPRMTHAEALRALQTSTTELLGASAQLHTVGERSTVTFKAVSANALSSWLSQVRTQARALPVQAQFKRSAVADGGATGSGAPTWSGSVVLSLPAP